MTSAFFWQNLLVFALLHSVFQGQICLLLQVFLDFLLLAESEEELKSLLMKVKVESEKVGSKLNIQKRLRSWLLVPSLHGK